MTLVFFKLTSIEDFCSFAHCGTHSYGSLCVLASIIWFIEIYLFSIDIFIDFENVPRTKKFWERRCTEYEEAATVSILKVTYRYHRI